MTEGNAGKTSMEKQQKGAVIRFTEEACQDVALTGGKGASRARR